MRKKPDSASVESSFFNCTSVFYVSVQSQPPKYCVFRRCSVSDKYNFILFLSDRMVCSGIHRSSASWNTAADRLISMS